MNVSRNRKVKKLAYLPGYWLKFAAGGVFLDSKSKINNKFFATSFWRQNDVNVKYLYIACRKCIWRHYDVLLVQFFLKTSIYLLLIRDYHHTKFGLIWIKENKAMGGGGAGRGGIRHPQIEDVLNRPGEIGLNSTKIARKPRNREMKIFFQYLKRILFCIKLPFQWYIIR